SFTNAFLQVHRRSRVGLHFHQGRTRTMGPDRFRGCRIDCCDSNSHSENDVARRRTRSRRDDRRDLQPSYRPWACRDGRRRFALRLGARRRGLQSCVAFSATPPFAAHRSVSMKRPSPLNAAAVEVLRQGESLLRSISDNDYTRKLPAAFHSAVGGHYRHCLDHFESMLRGFNSGAIDYDNRNRDVRIENDRAFALSETSRILKACEAIPVPFLDCPINVRSKVNYELDGVPLIASTVGRELMYAVAHAIHHYALIAVMCGMLGVRVPSGFGVAPSTLKYQADQQRAA